MNLTHQRHILGAVFLCLLSSITTPITKKVEHNKLPAHSYAKIGSQLISSYGTIDTETESDKEEKVNLELVEIDDQVKRQIIYTALEQNGVLAQQKGISAHALAEDIELFYAQDEQDHSKHLFSAITAEDSTMFGEAILAKMIGTPLQDIHQLQARQDLVKLLVQDEELFDTLNDAVKQIKGAESAIFSYWQEDNKLTKDLIDKLYFGSLLTGLNKNAIMLEAWTRLGNLGTAVGLAQPLYMQPLVILGYKRVFGPSLAEKSAEAKKWVDSITFKSTLIGQFKLPIVYGWAVLRNKEDDFIKNAITAITGLTDHPSEIIEAVPQFRTSAGLFGFGAAMQVIQGTYNGKQLLTVAKMHRDAGKFLQTKLIGVGTLVAALKKINDLQQAEPVIANGLLLSKTTKNLFGKKAQQSARFKELIGLLETETFKGQASFFSLTGRVLKAHKLMEECKDEFVPLMEAFGEMDACLSIAKLYKKFQNERVTYEFVEYVEDAQQPYVHLHNFWNVLVPTDKVVTNSLELGTTDRPRNVILTGSNMAGKSTSLKAILLNMLLAHTLTISTGKTTITPLCYIGSSLNIIDNTAAGKSLYQAEVDRAAQLQHAAWNLNGFGFTVVDELFRGTGPEQAIQETYNCAKNIFNAPNNMCIIATHYTDRITKLEQETNGLCKNYKIEAHVSPNGTIVRPFKLEEGINSQNIASALLKEAQDKLRS